MGFGLGLAVVTDPAEDLAAMLFTQLTPYGVLPLQRDLAQLIYPALTGRRA